MNAQDRGASSGRAVEAPRITLLVITDGRWDYLTDCLASADAHLQWPFVERILVDDSAVPGCPDPDGWTIVRNPERLGLAGAIQAGWDVVGDCDYVFHLEDDFVFPQPVDVGEMVWHLDNDPELAQVALLRQPWSPEEQHAGSVYAVNPGDYTESAGLVLHERLFTFNPCVYPKSISEGAAGLERDVTDRLLADGRRFAYLGDLRDPPRCWHIGRRRSIGHRW